MVLLSTDQDMARLFWLPQTAVPARMGSCLSAFKEKNKKPNTHQCLFHLEVVDGSLRVGFVHAVLLFQHAQCVVSSELHGGKRQFHFVALYTITAAPCSALSWNSVVKAL